MAFFWKNIIRGLVLSILMLLAIGALQLLAAIAGALGIAVGIASGGIGFILLVVGILIFIPLELFIIGWLAGFVVKKIN